MEHETKKRKIDTQAEKDKAALETKVLNSKLHTNCFYTAATAINSLHGHGHLLDLSTLVNNLIDGAKKVTGGDLKEVEHMLMMHAKTLDYVFYDALKHLTDLNMINQIEAFANIAFRAQSQSRKTLAVLAEIKHPKRATFIHKQNNAIQVNNAVMAENLKNSEKIIKNELIAEVTHEI